MAKSTPTLYERLTFVESVGSIGKEAEKLVAAHNIFLDPLNISDWMGQSVRKTIEKTRKGLEKDISKAEKQYDGKISQFYDMAGMTPSDIVFPHLCFFRNPDGHYTVAPLPAVDVPAVQKSVMEKYKDNPVFKDAAEGKKTIEETLGELSKINKGIRFFLPRRKNKEHNERLGYFSELAGCDRDLRARGSFIPDNFVSGAAGGALICGVAAYLAPSSPNEIVEYKSLIAEIGGTSLFFGVFWHITMRISSQEISTIDQAKYLDTKIQEVYAPAKSG